MSFRILSANFATSSMPHLFLCRDREVFGQRMVEWIQYVARFDQTFVWHHFA
jgi:hypothetical protein